jgi:hypothetical protein
MRKKLILSITIFLSLCLLANLARAEITITNPLRFGTFQELINAIVNFLFTISLALSSVMVVIAGYHFVTASGDPKKIQTAKNIILYTLIGLGVIFFAKALNGILKLITQLE